MSTLYLPLRKEWFEKIEAGEKTTEYREYKDYWIRRLKRTEMYCHGADVYGTPGKIYDYVCFALGYGGKSMTFVVDDVSVVDGKNTDLAIDKPVFAIKLGRRLYRQGEILEMKFRAKKSQFQAKKSL